MAPEGKGEMYILEFCYQKPCQVASCWTYRLRPWALSYHIKWLFKQELQDCAFILSTLKKGLSNLGEKVMW